MLISETKWKHLYEGKRVRRSEEEWKQISHVRIHNHKKSWRRRRNNNAEVALVPLSVVSYLSSSIYVVVDDWRKEVADKGVHRHAMWPLWIMNDFIDCQAAVGWDVGQVFWKGRSNTDGKGNEVNTAKWNESSVRKCKTPESNCLHVAASWISKKSEQVINIPDGIQR